RARRWPCCRARARSTPWLRAPAPSPGARRRAGGSPAARARPMGWPNRVRPARGRARLRARDPLLPPPGDGSRARGPSPARRAPRRGTRAPPPDAHVAPRGAEPGLLVAHEPFVVDDAERLVQRGLVVAAVVHERRRVLKDDLVVVRELLGPEQVAPADLDAVETELPGRE